MCLFPGGGSVSYRQNYLDVAGVGLLDIRDCRGCRSRDCPGSGRGFRGCGSFLGPLDVVVVEGAADFGQDVGGGLVSGLRVSGASCMMKSVHGAAVAFS